MAREAIFTQHEFDVVPLRPQDFVVIVGRYNGNDDRAIDKANADTELAKFYPNRFLESCTANVSANTATSSGGAYDADISPLVYVNDVLIDESAYTATPATGVFSAFSPALAPGDTVKATLVRAIKGVTNFDAPGEFGQDLQELRSAAQDAYVYRRIKEKDAKFSVTVEGTYDIRRLRNKYPGQELQKMVFGSDWVLDAANELKSNAEKFFVAGIWRLLDNTTTGDVYEVRVINYGCKLTKPVMPNFKGAEDVAVFSIEAEVLYQYGWIKRVA